MDGYLCDGWVLFTDRFVLRSHSKRIFDRGFNSSRHGVNIPIRRSHSFHIGIVHLLGSFDCIRHSVCNDHGRSTWIDHREQSRLVANENTGYWRRCSLPFTTWSLEWSQYRFIEFHDCFSRVFNSKERSCYEGTFESKCPFRS